MYTGSEPSEYVYTRPEVTQSPTEKEWEISSQIYSLSGSTGELDVDGEPVR